MLVAAEEGMTRGDYVFFTMELVSIESDYHFYNDTWKGDDGRDKEARDALETIFHVGTN